MKIIPAIDIMDGQVVRLLKGRPQDKTVYGNDPVEIAKKWEKAGADMLHVVDLDATLGRGRNIQLVKKISGAVSIPVQIAGGLRTIPLIQDAMKSSSRIVLGTLAFKDRDALKQISKFDLQRIVISVDHIDGSIVINGWQDRAGVDLFDAMRDFLDIGFVNFLLTNVNRDGMMNGPDLQNLKQACLLPNANVIASGGISEIKDVNDVKANGAYGVILGKALYEGRVSIQEAKLI